MNYQSKSDKDLIKTAIATLAKKMFIIRDFDNEKTSKLKIVDIEWDGAEYMPYVLVVSGNYHALHMNKGQLKKLVLDGWAVFGAAGDYHHGVIAHVNIGLPTYKRYLVRDWVKSDKSALNIFTIAHDRYMDTYFLNVTTRKGKKVEEDAQRISQKEAQAYMLDAQNYKLNVMIYERDKIRWI